jgi:molybdopterin-synthase adenylyltransferase
LNDHVKNYDQTRYSRHLVLPQIGPQGQARLSASRVLIMGLGGLGSPVGIYLAASGVGQLVLIDYDVVELSNLQRQPLHTTASIGQDKASSAKTLLTALNPDIEITARNENLDDEALFEEVKQADAVVDATDNFSTRFALNRACVAAKIPLISGAVIRMEGQVTVFRPDHPDSPCYRCLYQEMDEIGEACAQVGILAPVAGIIGAIQATETIKVLLDLHQSLEGRLLLLDAETMQWRELKLKKDPRCPVCGHA